MAKIGDVIFNAALSGAVEGMRSHLAKPSPSEKKTETVAREHFSEVNKQTPPKTQERHIVGERKNGSNSSQSLNGSSPPSKSQETKPRHFWESNNKIPPTQGSPSEKEKKTTESSKEKGSTDPSSPVQPQPGTKDYFLKSYQGMYRQKALSPSKDSHQATSSVKPPTTPTQESSPSQKKEAEENTEEKPSENPSSENRSTTYSWDQVKDGIKDVFMKARTDCNLNGGSKQDKVHLHEIVSYAAKRIANPKEALKPGKKYNQAADLIEKNLQNYLQTIDPSIDAKAAAKLIILHAGKAQKSSICLEKAAETALACIQESKQKQPQRTYIQNKDPHSKNGHKNEASSKMPIKTSQEDGLKKEEVNKAKDKSPSEKGLITYSWDQAKDGIKTAFMKGRADSNLDGSSQQEKVHLHEIVSYSAKRIADPKEALKPGKKYNQAADLIEKNLEDYLHTIDPSIDAKNAVKFIIFHAGNASKSSVCLEKATDAAVAYIQDHKQNRSSFSNVDIENRQRDVRTQSASVQAYEILGRQNRTGKGSKVHPLELVQASSRSYSYPCSQSYSNPSNPKGEYLLGIAEIIAGGALMIFGGFVEFGSFGSLTLGVMAVETSGFGLITHGLGRTMASAQKISYNSPSCWKSAKGIPAQDPFYPSAIPKKGSIDPSLPVNPDDLLKRPGWKETTHPNAGNSGHRTFENKETGEKLRHDLGKPGKSGHEAHSHYHRPNPNSKGNHDEYLDGEGNPVRNHSEASHIYPPDNAWWKP